MDYVSIVIESFWQYQVALAGVLAAIVGIKFIFSFINRRLR